MPYLTQLAAVARRTGYPVIEQSGWKSRGHGAMSAVRSVICHHDAGGQADNQFNWVVQNGRTGLPGPLSHFTIRRDAVIHVVAAGLSYHAGENINNSLYGNPYSIGIEAANRGTGQAWPAAQLDAYKKLCAELCKEFNLPSSRVMGHKEIAPSRKIDPYGINMNDFRSDVSRIMSGGGSPAPIGTTTNEDSVMLCPAGTNEHICVPNTAAQNPWLFVGCEDDVVVHAAVYVGPTKGGTLEGNYLGGFSDVTFKPGRPGPVEYIPNDTRMVVLRYTATKPFTAFVV